jgi:hypothetical protein
MRVELVYYVVAATSSEAWRASGDSSVKYSSTALDAAASDSWLDSIHFVLAALDIDYPAQRTRSPFGCLVRYYINYISFNLLQRVILLVIFLESSFLGLVEVYIHIVS